MATVHGRHRAARRSALGVTTMSLISLVGTAVLGSAPTVAAAASTLFVRGTDGSSAPAGPRYQVWVDQTVEVVCGAHAAPTEVDYPAAFWPLSDGVLTGPTYDNSVDDGVLRLTAAVAAGGEAAVFIHGYSQGAVVATEYMRSHPGAGHTYILAANPNRPNGGILNRFAGLYIPILDVSFNGATPTDDETVIDIARQYDGWADFPANPLNLLATANAVMGILYLHDEYVGAVTPEVLAGLEPTTHGNTTYYLVPTERLPLLLPFDGIVPDQLLDAIDVPLRAIIETAYDRTDYGEPTGASVLPPHARAPVTPSAPESEPTADSPARDAAIAEPDDEERAPSRRAGTTPRTTVPAPADDGDSTAGNSTAGNSTAENSPVTSRTRDHDAKPKSDNVARHNRTQDDERRSDSRSRTDAGDTDG